MTNQPAAAVAAADGPPLTNKRQVGKYTQQLTLTLLVSIFMPLWILWTWTMEYILQWLLKVDNDTGNDSRLIGNLPAKTILENKYYHDVTLQGKDGMEVTSNKAVLAASCTVFRDMFDGQQAAKDAEAMVTEVVKLPLEGNTIKAILHYIHSGNLGQIVPPKESSSTKDDEHDKGRDAALKQARDIAALLDLEHAAAKFLNLPGFTKTVKVVSHEWLKENEWCPSLELCRRSPALQEKEEPEDLSSLGQYELYNILLDGRSQLVKAATTDNNNKDLEGDKDGGSGDDDDKNSFTSLPEGVLYQILRYVITTTKDVCPLRVTCQKAKEMVDEHIYRRLIYTVEESDDSFFKWCVDFDWNGDWCLRVYWDDVQGFFVDRYWSESYKAYERKHLSNKSDRWDCHKLTPKEAFQIVVPLLERKSPEFVELTIMIPLVWSLLINAKDTSMFYVEDLTREYPPDREKNFKIYFETKQGHFYRMDLCN